MELRGTLSRCQHSKFCRDGIVYLLPFKDLALRNTLRKISTVYRTSIEMFLINELIWPRVLIILEKTWSDVTLWRCGPASAWTDCRSVPADPQCSLLTGSSATAMRPGWTTWRTPTSCRFVAYTISISS